MISSLLRAKTATNKAFKIIKATKIPNNDVELIGNLVKINKATVSEVTIEEVVRVDKNDDNPYLTKKYNDEKIIVNPKTKNILLLL